MGVTNEGMRQIFARAGVNTIELGESIEIPSGKDNVTVRLMDEEAWNNLSDKKPDEQLKFANQKNVSFGKVYINDKELEESYLQEEVVTKAVNANIKATAKKRNIHAIKIISK